ncbi:MAG TPA: transcription antitermination factor NusB [Bryobacteraceae bacterium]|nr:transcription antitermination factor NusB [Bryobacteraceae bacterium]
MISIGRQVAFDVLEAVSNDAYASDSLRNLSKKAPARDAGLAGQIVFGCLRYQSQLDYLIEMYSGRKTQTLDPAVLLALRTAIFQLRYLERIPAYAAVHDSVELVKRRKRAATGLTNAVLRKVTRAEASWPDAATELSCPAWLLDRWERHFGSSAARAIASAALLEPPPYIRVPAGATLPEGVEAEPTGVPGCYRLKSEVLPGMRLHDIGSQSIVPLLDLQPGLSYLDLCSAPGNKTMQALETPLGLAVACDIAFKRLREVPPVCPRVVLDASEPLPFSTSFDRIFVDAPCSGTGTLARNPEIKWRVRETDWARFAAKQVRLAENAARLLAPGGKLVYATCSLEQEENEDVVRAVLSAHPELRLDREVWRLPGRDEGDGFYAAIIIRN